MQSHDGGGFKSTGCVFRGVRVGHVPANKVTLCEAFREILGLSEHVILERAAAKLCDPHKTLCTEYWCNCLNYFSIITSPNSAFKYKVD